MRGRRKVKVEDYVRLLCETQLCGVSPLVSFHFSLFFVVLRACAQPVSTSVVPSNQWKCFYIAKEGIKKNATNINNRNFERSEKKQELHLCLRILFERSDEKHELHLQLRIFFCQFFKMLRVTFGRKHECTSLRNWNFNIY